MTKKLAWKNDEGGISIFTPHPDFADKLDDIAAQIVPQGKTYKIIDDANMPTDRTKRNSWDFDTAKKKIIEGV